MSYEVMSAAELKTWRRAYHLSRQALADLLGVHMVTVRRWEIGHTPVPAWLPLALETIAGHRKQLVKALRQRRERVRLEKVRAKNLRGVAL